MRDAAVDAIVDDGDPVPQADKMGSSNLFEQALKEMRDERTEEEKRIAN